MFIRSERLFLRPGWPEDWRELLPLMDQDIVRDAAFAAWPYSAKDVDNFAAVPQEAAAPQEGHLPHFLVTLPGAEGPRLIGTCGLYGVTGDVELASWIARDHRGRGYATEAGRAVLALARALGHQRVVSSHFADNPASGRVLGKIGFLPTGNVRPRFSRGRGEAVPAAEFAIDLTPQTLLDDDPDMSCRAA
jgi:RimJ/RimL family protein N-acetyltransferase